MGKGADRRNRIFKAFSSNLEGFCSLHNIRLEDFVVRPIDKLVFPLYICPICYKLHNEQSLNSSEPELTLEHVPPNSVGGKANALTCKTCNNFDATELDLILLKNEQIKNFGKGNSSIPVDIKKGEKLLKGIPMTMNSKEGKFKITVEQGKRAYAFGLLKDFLENHDGSSMQLQFKGVDSNNHTRALIRTAYLILFEYLGYPYLFSKGGIRVHQHLIGNKQFEITRNVVVNLPKMKSEIDPGVYYTQNDQYNSFLVVFEMRTKKDQGVISKYILDLPLGHVQFLNDYLEADTKEKFKFRLTRLERPFLDQVVSADKLINWMPEF